MMILELYMIIECLLDWPQAITYRGLGSGVADLTEQSLPIPEDPGSNSLVSNF